MGYVLIVYAGYYVLILLNIAGIIPGIFNFLLEAIFFLIMVQLVIFTKETFYKNRGKIPFICYLLIILVLGGICCVLAELGDLSEPYSGIFDNYDEWRYIIDDFIVGPLVFVSIAMSSARAYRKVNDSMPTVKRRLLYIVLSEVSFLALWILNFFTSYFSGIMYPIYFVAIVVVVGFIVYGMYIGWLSKETSIQQIIDLSTISLPDSNQLKDKEHVRIKTDIAAYRILEILGNELASIIK
ncbi:MAG TPA: hypothetical protein VKM55_29835 [Candidatus Lokiarchaeia archaeon]|nr:hypothetical protein [Candidatus Lokiarchaeia archaeon]